MNLDGFTLVCENEKAVMEDTKSLDRQITLYFILAIISLWTFWSLL